MEKTESLILAYYSGERYEIIKIYTGKALKFLKRLKGILK